MKPLLFLVLITASFSANPMNWFKTPPPSPTKKSPELPLASTQRSSVQPPLGAPITINVNVAPTQTTTTSSSAASDAKAQTNTAVDTQTQLSAYLKSCAEYKEHIQEGYMHYKYYLIAGTCMTLYLYLCYDCLQGNMFLQTGSLWSSFKQELSFEDLCNLDSPTLTEELLRTLHSRYIIQKDPLSTLEPMATFLHEIEAERKKLHHYQTLYSWAKLLRVTAILPAKSVVYDTIPARLQRLAFIRHIFVSWTCTVKLKKTGPWSLDQ